MLGASPQPYAPIYSESQALFRAKGALTLLPRDHGGLCACGQIKVRFFPPYLVTILLLLHQ
jgi:hypothetical protein